MEVTNKQAKEDLFTKTRDKLRATDFTEIVVNGQTITVSEYYKDPKKYNEQPLDPKYAKECELHLENSIQTKAKLHIDPSSLRSML